MLSNTEDFPELCSNGGKEQKIDAKLRHEAFKEKRCFDDWFQYDLSSIDYTELTEKAARKSGTVIDSIRN
jgi:hypothetical protein